MFPVLLPTMRSVACPGNQTKGTIRVSSEKEEVVEARPLRLTVEGVGRMPESVRKSLLIVLKLADCSVLGPINKCYHPALAGLSLNRQGDE